MHILTSKYTAKSNRFWLMFHLKSYDLHFWRFKKINNVDNN